MSVSDFDGMLVVMPDTAMEIAEHTPSKNHPEEEVHFRPVEDLQSLAEEFSDHHLVAAAVKSRYEASN